MNRTMLPGRLRRRTALAAALAGATCMLPAWAQTYPTRPIRMVVPFPAGALTDSLGRTMAEVLRTELGQPVVVENRAGAGTLLGASQVARSAPDGYSLLIATSTTLAISPAMYANPAATRADFTPVAMIGGVTLLLVARPDFPATSLRSLVDESRRRPSTYNFASPGTGTMHQLLFEMLKVEQKIAITHVPYQGSVGALTDLLAGRVDFMFIDAAAGLPHVRAGKLKVIAVNAARRLASLPAVPTLVETHPTLDMQAWQAVVAPKGTPDEITKRLNEDINRALGTAPMRETLAAVGVEAMPMTIEALDQLITRDVARFSGLVRAAGARAT